MGVYEAKQVNNREQFQPIPLQVEINRNVIMIDCLLKTVECLNIYGGWGCYYLYIGTL